MKLELTRKVGINGSFDDATDGETLGNNVGFKHCFIAHSEDGRTYELAFGKVLVITEGLLLDLKVELVIACPVAMMMRRRIRHLTF